MRKRKPKYPVVPAPEPLRRFCLREWDWPLLRPATGIDAWHKARTAWQAENSLSRDYEIDGHPLTDHRSLLGDGLDLIRARRDARMRWAEGGGENEAESVCSQAKCGAHRCAMQSLWPPGTPAYSDGQTG